MWTAASLVQKGSLMSRTYNVIDADADRRGQFATDVEPAFPERIESLRRCLAGQACELFKFGLFHAHFMARRVPT